MNRRWVLLLLLLLSGCSVVRMHRVRDDFDRADRQKTKRLAVVVQPLPAGEPKVGELWSLVARRYVDQKRNFIVKKDLVQAEPFQLAAACTDGVEAALWLQPDVRPKGSGYEVAVQGRLLRCAEGEEIWAGDAGGSFSSEDSKLLEVGNHYAAELGPQVKPHVAPAFNVLRPLLDTLPDPVLTDDEQVEKAECAQ